MASKKVTFDIKLPPDLFAVVNTVSELSGVSVSNVVAVMVATEMLRTKGAVSAAAREAE